MKLLSFEKGPTIFFSKGDYYVTFCEKVTKNVGVGCAIEICKNLEESCGTSKLFCILIACRRANTPTPPNGYSPNCKKQ